MRLTTLIYVMSSWKHAERWRQVQLIAGTAHGLISLHELRSAGFTDPQVRSLVRQMRLKRLHRGIYHVVGSPLNWRSQLLLLTRRTNGLASHLSAAMLYEIGRARDLTPGFAEVTARRAPSHRVDNMQIYQAGDFDALEAHHPHRIPTTSIERCVLDIAATHPANVFDTVLNAAVRKGLTTFDRVKAEFELDPRRRNRRNIEAALDRLDGSSVPAMSEWSIWALQLLVSAGLPTPLLEHRILDPAGLLVAQVDLYFPQFRLAIELDGRAYHLDPHSFQIDRSRDAALAGLGIVVLRFTWEQYCTPGYFLRTVKAALSAQAA